LKEHDISDAKTVELEARIAVLEEQLAQKQPLAILGELTSTTTHEFNNVLTTITNYAKLGLRHKDEATRTRALEQILTAANRAAKITSVILATAKNRKSQMESTDIVALTEDAMFLLDGEMIKYRIRVEKLFQKGVPEIIADGNQIQRVLLNLLVNARQAMPDGGRLVVKILHDAENETADLVIRDYGCGIPADKLPHIFDKYYTTKSGPDDSGKGGSGIGLASCKEIIETHRGVIRVESSVGKGTCFTVKLPTAVRAKILGEE